jgi:hypothetical protein
LGLIHDGRKISGTAHADDLHQITGMQWSRWHAGKGDKDAASGIMDE